jgi:beta-glucosidase
MATSWWGTAAAATQCEGAAPRADWAGWEAEGRAPASRDGNGFRTRYADDFALLADHGITHHRLTVEWARLEPEPGRWDEDEAAHLRRVLATAREAGVEVWACLLHGSAPGWFSDDQRGWLDDKAASLTWPRHVDRVAEAIGDLVAGWVPVHEPDLAARLGYGDGTFHPAAGPRRATMMPSPRCGPPRPRPPGCCARAPTRWGSRGGRATTPTTTTWSL